MDERNQDGPKNVNMPSLKQEEIMVMRVSGLFGANPEVFSGAQAEFSNRQIEFLKNSGIITDNDIEETEKQASELEKNGKSGEELNERPDEKEEPKEDEEELSQNGDVISTNGEQDKTEEKDEEEAKVDEDKPLTAKQINEGEELRKRVLSVISNLPVDPKETELKFQLLNAYGKVSSESYYRHFEDKKFLNETEFKDNIHNTRVDAEEMHALIRGAVAVQDYIQENSEEMAGESAGKVSKEDSTVIKVPEVLDELPKEEQLKAREEMKRRIRQMIYAAVNSNERPERILIEIASLKGRVEREQQDLADSLGGSDEAKQAFLEDMDTAEIAAVVEGAMNSTDHVEVSFEHINWANPAERKKAIALLNEVQLAPDVPINKINTKIVISNEADLEAAKKATTELEDIGIPAEVEVVTNDKELEEKAEEELGGGNVEVEATEDVNKEIAETGMAIVMGVAAGATAIDSLGIDKEYEEEQEISMGFGTPV
ncbi:MAG: hypothetical protein IJ217_02855 [Clostridia bacterium]|nr:hypothetical protein [Clostridia bacterium]